MREVVNAENEQHMNHAADSVDFAQQDLPAFVQDVRCQHKAAIPND